jgi:dienelactone hydrolase
LLHGVARAQTVERVNVPEGGLLLQTEIFVPDHVTGPTLVALHGCGGAFPRRDRQWAALFNAAGHVVLFPDSFGSRGLGSQCRATVHKASAYTERVGDAVAAAVWARQKFGQKVWLMGWSDGGTTVLATVRKTDVFAGAVAMYPACTRLLRKGGWAPRLPLHIFIGASDDWTPAAPCRALAAQAGVGITVFAGAYHDFDAPDDPIHVLTGLPYTANDDGTAHAGENAAARDAVLAAVPAFFDGLGALPKH